MPPTGGHPPLAVHRTDPGQQKGYHAMTSVRAALLACRLRQNSESVVVGSQPVGYPSPFIEVR